MTTAPVVAAAAVALSTVSTPVQESKQHKPFVWLEKPQQTIFGHVVRSQDVKTGELVAVKMSLISKIKLARETKVTCEDPVRETQLMKQLHDGTLGPGHRNILRIVQDYVYNETYCVAMELADGGDLFSLVERTMKCSRGSIQESLARFYFAQVAAGVSYLHKCGVAHLDIKPENLLLTSTGQVKICDFGMARVVASAATNGAPFSAPVMLRGAVGTVMYMAPEVHGKRRFNPFQADAYSLGVVLFMLLTGQHMYETPALSDARFAMVISGPDGIKRLLAALGLLRKLSVEAVELLCHLISADPSLRFTADEVLAHEWFTPMRAPVQVTSTSLSASAAPLASPAASVPPAASAPYVASAADTDAKQKPVGSQSASGSCSDRKTDGAAIVPMDESSDFDASSSCSATSPRVRMTIASSAAPRLDSLDGVVITSASDAAAPGATAVSIKSAFQPRRSTRFRAPRCFRDTSRSEKRVAV